MSDSRGEWRNPHPDSALNGVNVVVLNKLARAAYEKDAHFIVFVGDLISGYTRDISSIYLQYRTWKEAVAGVNAYIPIYEVVGNHDSSAPHAKRKPGKEDVFAEDIWRIVFTLPENGPTNHPALPTYLENVYSFNYAGCRFIILNSNYYDLKGATPQDRFARTIDEIQRDWLQLDLEENKNARFHFVFFHEPAYPCGGHLGSSLDHLPDVRDAVMSILDKYRVDAFYCGHEHNYSRLLVNKRVNPNLKGGVWQIITGGAGAPLYPQDMKIPWAKLVDEFASEYHWVLVEVGKRRASFTVYNDKGKVLDRFTTLRRKKLK